MTVFHAANRIRPTRIATILGLVLRLTILQGFSGEAEIAFESEVRPVFKEFCFDCHGAEQTLEADLDLRLRRLIVRGGESGPAIVPGEPAKSLLIERLREGEMPPRGKKVPGDKIALITRWIQEGAPTARAEPETLAAGEVYITEDERAFWSFQPITRPLIPKAQGKDAHRIRTPIDALIWSAGNRDSERFQFAPDADRRTFIRRVSLDLTGLPPTRHEIDAFLSDSSASAVDDLIDRLLQSPHYGERWARHWLDVAGYSDSEGVTNRDTPRPWAWKYRDYVVRSLNRDKPFDRFIIEQLAGDELVPPPHKNLSSEQIELLTGTGFLRMAADGTGSGSDTETSRNQTLADTLKIVSSSFLGLTLECAQCHDHRYDPIPHRDYYQFRAIFEPALDPNQWRKPSERLVSLYRDADHEKAAEVEREASVILNEKATLQQTYIEEALRKEIENFPEDLREPLFNARMTAGDKRTPEQVELLKKYPSANITGGNLYQYNQKAADELKEFDARVSKVREQKPYHTYLRALAEPTNSTAVTRLFHRGDLRQPVGDPLVPAALTIAAPTGKRFEIPPKDPQRETSGRRLAFAQWLTSGKHPLVARVLVNRVWMHHFGRGLVGTPGNFGILGERPTHPEVLDFLADEFMANGWSLKHLHRLILRSTVYRQSSNFPDADASPTSYSNWPVQRLDAETIRDRTLAVSGILDRTLHGPPVGVSGNDAGQFSIDGYRRSLYANTRRSQPVTLLKSFDAPQMEINCNRRDSSNAATQALIVMNGDFHAACSRQFAERIRRECGRMGSEYTLGRATDFDIPERLNSPDEPTIVAQITYAFDLAYGRPAADWEIRRSLTFLDRQISHQLEKNAELTAPEARLEALARLCHVFISSNEFLYVD